MKRAATIITLLTATLGMALSLQSNVQAAWSPEVQRDETVTVAKDDVRKGSLYAMAKTVKIEGTVEGDVYCAADNVIISGLVTGDVSCAAGTIAYSGQTRGNVRFAGSDVRMTGASVGADASLFASTARLDEKTTIAGDLNGAAQLLDFNARVARNIIYAGVVTTLNGVVAGDANIKTDALSIGDKAEIKGDLFYSASRELANKKDAIKGQLVYNAPASIKPADVLMMLLKIAMATAFTGLVLALVVPRFIDRSSQIAGARLGKTALVGSAIVFFAPLAALVLFLTGIGVPLAAVVLLMYVALVLLSGAFFAYYLGAVLLRSTQSILVRMIGGTVVLGALWLIPVINIIAMVATVVIGVGIIVRTVLHGYRKPRYEVGELPSSTPSASSSADVPAASRTLEAPRPIADAPKKKRPTKPKASKPKK